MLQSECWRVHLTSYRVLKQTLGGWSLAEARRLDHAGDVLRARFLRGLGSAA